MPPPPTALFPSLPLAPQVVCWCVGNTFFFFNHTIWHLKYRLYIYVVFSASTQNSKLKRCVCMSALLQGWKWSASGSKTQQGNEAHHCTSELDTLVQYICTDVSLVFPSTHIAHIVGLFVRAVGGVGRSCLRGWGVHSTRLCSETSTTTSGTKPREVRPAEESLHSSS